MFSKTFCTIYVYGVKTMILLTKNYLWFTYLLCVRLLADDDHANELIARVLRLNMFVGISQK